MNKFVIHLLLSVLIIRKGYCRDVTNLIQSKSRTPDMKDSFNHTIQTDVKYQHFIEDVNNTDIMDYEDNFRAGRFFPFYTIGRFQNAGCIGSNMLMGTCVLGGECMDANGIATGPCSPLTRQAVCCIYQQTCGQTTANNNTYFVNPGFPGQYSGGSGCSITINPCSNSTCQLRIDFLDLTLAQPSGDGACLTDVITITGGSSNVPPLCGQNSGQHVYINFSGQSSITISISTSPTTFNRHWNLLISQYNCGSAQLAPSGCLQYYQYGLSGSISSFNYNAAPNPALNSIGVEGSRQLANMAYGICIGEQPNQCTITYGLNSDIYSFTVTGDVGAVDSALIGTGALQSQTCTTDYIIIPDPSQNGATLTSDRFCGLGFVSTTSNAAPFVVYVVTDGNENLDISNRGFSLSYTQNSCPI